jgi:class 3 adenylate cyclase
VSRLSPLDRVLIIVLVPLWLVCFGLALRTQLQDQGVAPVELRVADADSYPVLTGSFLTELYLETNPLETAGLRAGDRLVRAGSADLRGVGSIGFNARALRHAEGAQSVAVVFERDGVQHETSLPLASMSFSRPQLPSALSVVVAGLFLILRARPTSTVRAYFYLAMCGGFFRVQFPGPGLQFYFWVGIFWMAAALFFPLTLRFMARFPDDRVPPGRWRAIWPWLFVVLGPFNALMFLGYQKVGTTGFFVTVAVGVCAMLAVVTRKYLAADPVGRRQMRWFVFGCYCVAVPPATAAVLTALDPRLAWLWWASFLVTPLLPLAIVISVVRFNLFDVDRLLSATASYNVLLMLLAAGALVVVPRIAEALSGAAGLDPGIGQAVLSLVLAGLVVPAHQRLRPQIERVFFKERYAVDRGIAELLPRLSTCADARALTERVGAGLGELFRPEACVVYAAVEGSYAPVFVSGRTAPSAFDSASPLIGTLRERRGPLSLSAAGRSPDAVTLGPFDRAALETLEAQVIVPVHQGDVLAAFLCLGPKRSGDVYTRTDLSHLTSLGEAVSQQLQRFDQEQTIREAREMQHALRRYVPGAVAEQLGSGAELAAAEREVSVLFVDIRGYTAFSEGRSAREIFGAVNRYTETVSQIVQKHAGSVAEFNGDGMMAVFGAPRELAHKERAAVEAGREIAEAVGALSVDGTRLSVGVGIATGEAFVGNIQAVDRMIWSAIGNTTNLAARLQALTRELDASLVIDGTTWQRAGAAAAEFEQRPGVEIRGRRETQDLYILTSDGSRERRS